MHTRSIALLDLFEHTVDIGGGKVHACRRSNYLEFGRSLAAGFVFARLYQGLPDPFGDGHTAQARRALDIAIFGVLNDNLQPFSHIVSVVDSSI